MVESDSFTLDYTPSRIVSLVPSQTELLFDLGLEQAIVGVTKFCIHPKKAKKTKKIVGGTKTIHLDRIKALQPDIILCNKEENTKEIVDSCSTIAPVHVSDIFDLEDATELIRTYGKIFSKKEKADDIIQRINKVFQEFSDFVRSLQTLKVAYFIWRNPWMIAAQHTFIDHLLSVNKFQNVFSHLDRYPEVTMEDIVSANPEYIFLSSEPYPFKESHIKELQDFVPNAKIVLVDGEMFGWYGSRLEKAFSYFSTLRKSLETSIR